MSNLDNESDLLPSDAPGCPTLSRKYRSVFSDTDITLDETYKTIFTYTGSGKFIGTILSFDDTSPRVRVTIDGEELFDLEMEDILDYQVDASSKGVAGSGGPAVFNNKFLFHPDCPIAYSATVLIEAKDKDGKKLRRSSVNLTKET